MRTVRICEGAREILAAANEEARRFEESGPWPGWTDEDYSGFEERLHRETHEAYLERCRQAELAAASYNPEPFGDEPPY